MDIQTKKGTRTEREGERASEGRREGGAERAEREKREREERSNKKTSIPPELTEIGVHAGFIRTTNYWNVRRRR